MSTSHREYVHGTTIKGRKPLAEVAVPPGNK
jgi:hypothetical protein